MSGAVLVRCTASLLALMLLASSAAAAPETGPASARPTVIEGIPYVEQPRGPFCVAAAAVMLARFHGRPLAVKPLARTLTVHADGIAWIDLVEALPAHRLEALLIDGSADDLRALFAAGLPALAIVRDGGGRHAWVVHGHGPDGWRVRDPAAPGLRVVDAPTFAARWTGGLVLIRPIDGSAPPALPWSDWRAESARVRAEGWLDRARQRPPTDALALLDHALTLDPGHVAVHLQRAAVLGELRRGPAACAAVAAARGYADAGVERQIADAVAAKLGCEPPGGTERADRPSRP